MPGTKVQEHGGSDKAMVWSCVDFADESQRMELFCIRFASAGVWQGQGQRLLCKVLLVGGWRRVCECFCPCRACTAVAAGPPTLPPIPPVPLMPPR